MSVLEFENVDAGYKATPVLHDVSLSIERGESVAVIGRNGVGKTTLMKTAIGLLEPTSGSIFFSDQDVTHMRADKRAKLGIGYTPQSRDVFPRMTVEENLRVGELVNEDSDTDHFAEIYELFPILAERKEQKAGTMSGGEQQMLSIARGLVGGPDILLLDEPSEGVQPSIISDISDVIQEVIDRMGATVLFAEQHLNFTMETADRCLALQKGEIIKELGPEEMQDPEQVQSYMSF